VGTRTEEVVDAALAVAARDGLGRLTMRAVAAEVGVTVMALYRHIPNKDQLLDAMIGRMLSEIELPDDRVSWQEGLRQVARQMLTLAQRYPTVLPLLLTRAYIAPPAVRLVRRLYELLDDADVPEDQVFQTERMFSTFLLGYTISAANNAFWDDEAASLVTARPRTPAPNRDGDPDRWTQELEQDVASFCALIATTRTE
jgi:AcrR family transcriptional regulator